MTSVDNDNIAGNRMGSKSPFSFRLKTWFILIFLLWIPMSQVERFCVSRCDAEIDGGVSINFIRRETFGLESVFIGKRSNAFGGKLRVRIQMREQGKLETYYLVGYNKQD